MRFPKRIRLKLNGEKSDRPVASGASMKEQSSGNIVLVIPVYNDWESVELLLPAVDEALERYPTPVHVLLVDDSSTVSPSQERLGGAYTNIVRIDVLHLRRNLGHQRAIAVGLCHASEKMAGLPVLVMDGDGEDRPEDVPRLLREYERHGRAKAVFAARTRRMESLAFRCSYHLYRLLHWLLTGIAVRIGNFSVLPPDAVTRLVVVSDLWNHYAAAVIAAHLPMTTLGLPRGPRLRGKSSMNFFALLAHGLGAISVYSDIVSVRLLAMAVAAVITVSGALLVSGGGSGLWVALVLSVQALISALLLVFFTLGARSRTSFLPLRDAHYFVLDIRPVYSAEHDLPLHRLQLAQNVANREHQNI